MSENNFEIAKIKLIIWDLDDTFWEGTLSEEGVNLIERNCDLVKKAADCGIISSICSKNDYEQVKKVLSENNMWEYFIYPSVNWEAKGFRIKNLISDLQLRDANVLFIDDNIGNINEAKYYNPNIMTGVPEALEDLYKQIDSLEKKDKEHARLKQYKIIEKKLNKKEEMGSNLEFLKSCNIRVSMRDDCLQKVDRLHELIMRTNQLNYTKKRITLEELSALLKDDAYQCGYVCAEDNFGDYGIIGFYSVNNNKLEHFLFSCRCMGMGIEQYIYAQLNYPELSVVGDVSIKLNNHDCPDYINIPENEENKNIKDNQRRRINDRVKILLKGPCDMQQIFSFIEDSENVVCEFTYISPKTGVSVEQHNHTQCILQSLSLSPDRLHEIEAELPFADEKMYSQSMFTEKYDIIFLSLLTDCGLGIYKRKATGEYVGFSQYNNSLTDPKEWQGYIDGTTPATNCKFNAEILKNISEKYEYIGRLSSTQILSNIKTIYSKLDKDTTLVLLLGSEIPYLKNENPSYQDRHLFHKEVNDKIKELSKSHPRIKYIEYSKMVNSQQDFYNNINHFMKPVYYKTAKEIMNIVHEVTGMNIKGTGNRQLFTGTLKQLIKRMIHRN